MNFRTGFGDSPDCIRATNGAPARFAPLSHSWERGRGRGSGAPHFAKPVRRRIDRLRSPDEIRGRQRGCTTDSPDCIRATDTAPTRFAPLSHLWERGRGRGLGAPHFAKPVRRRIDRLRSPDEIRGRATGLYCGFPGLHPGYGRSARTVCSPLPFMGEGPGERAERTAVKRPCQHLRQRNICSTRRFSSESSRWRASMREASWKLLLARRLA